MELLTAKPPRIANGIDRTLFRWSFSDRALVLVVVGILMVLVWLLVGAIWNSSVMAAAAGAVAGLAAAVSVSWRRRRLASELMEDGTLRKPKVWETSYAVIGGVGSVYLLNRGVSFGVVVFVVLVYYGFYLFLEASTRLGDGDRQAERRRFGALNRN